jgi:hypothetical protein
MSLRSEVNEFGKCCRAIIETLREKPVLLKDAERLDIEVHITHVMTAVVEAIERTRPHRSGGSPSMT